MKILKITSLTLMIISGMTAHANVVSDTANQMAGGLGEMLETAVHPGAISAEVGTLGYGANIAYGANEYTEVQLGWTGGDILDLVDPELEVEGVDYEAETDFSTPYVGVQLRPMKNWFTVGMGAMYMGNNEINAAASPTSGKSFTYQGKSYTAQSNAKIDATLEFKNTLSPYLSLGFRPNINNRIGLFGEIGAAYTGGINTEVDATGSYTYQGTTTELTESQIEDLENRAKKEIEDEISDYDDWYPIVKVGATLRF